MKFSVIVQTFSDLSYWSVYYSCVIVDQAIFFIPFPCYSFLTVGLVVGGLVSLFQSGEREVVLLADVEHMVDVTIYILE